MKFSKVASAFHAVGLISSSRSLITNHGKQAFSLLKWHWQLYFVPCSLESRLSFPSTCHISCITSSSSTTVLYNSNPWPKSYITEKGIYNKLSSQENVYRILSASVLLLEEYAAPEPLMSACHLFAQALKDDFPRWDDNGFAKLAKILKDPKYDKNLGEKKVTGEELFCYAGMLERRIKNEPLQYIIGQWDFHNCVLKVRPPCLCPRPETEELVEHAATDIREMIQTLRDSGSRRKVRILDVGCGTGAIGISLAKLFPLDVQVFSIDVSEDAIALSQENARFVLGDDQSHYFDPLLCSTRQYTGLQLNFDKHEVVFEYDLVVSNPPYIPSKDMLTLSLDVLDYEDHGALCGGEDGMDVVRDVLERLPEWCKSVEPRPFRAVCWMEVDPTHPDIIQNETRDMECLELSQKLKDFNGLDRFVKLIIK
jgi:release factor glutamine methyltransferase